MNCELTITYTLMATAADMTGNYSAGIVTDTVNESKNKLLSFSLHNGAEISTPTLFIKPYGEI